MIKYTHFTALTSLLLCTSLATADTLRVRVEGSDESAKQVPIRVPLDSPESLQDAQVVHLIADDGSRLVGQVTSSSLQSSSGARELHFVVPSLNKGETKSFTVHASNADQPSVGGFAWKDTPGVHADLTFLDRPILRYMYAALDNSSPAAREETYKVYHHVFDPDGEQIVTKGAGGQFSHHRGLFYGFNRISYGSKAADIWHCRKGESQQHRKFIQAETGPVLGRHRLAIDWHGRDGEVFAKELREMTVYNVPGGHLIEFASRLTSTVPSLTLDGDPQHAGFQFRASQEVAAVTKKQTYYLRPDGRGQPGETRNWSRDKPQHANLPWNAQSFVLGDQRYTCCYLDHPDNPKPARYSERDYGRFGSYFKHTFGPDQPLQLNYRIWLQKGEMEVAGVEALSDAFVQPPKVELTHVN